MSDPNQPEKIVVMVHSAWDLHSTNLIGKMDPYCVVTLGGQTYKTNVDVKGSKTPCWDQTFTFSYAGESHMRFKVMDKDKLSSDDYVGMTEVALGPIINGTRHYSAVLELSRKEGKKAGFMKVVIDCEPKLNKGVAKDPQVAAPVQAPAQVAPQTVYQAAPVYAAPPAYAPMPQAPPPAYAQPPPAYAQPPPVYAQPQPIYQAPVAAYSPYQQRPYSVQQPAPVGMPQVTIYSGPPSAPQPQYGQPAIHVHHGHHKSHKKKKKSKKRSSSSSSSSSD